MLSRLRIVRRSIALWFARLRYAFLLVVAFGCIIIPQETIDAIAIELRPLPSCGFSSPFTNKAFVIDPAAKIEQSPSSSDHIEGSHKLPLRSSLAAIAIFCNEVKGKAALAMSRDLGLSYKTAFVLCHKLREAMGEEMKGRIVGGEGKTAQIDADWFGGYVLCPAGAGPGRRPLTSDGRAIGGVRHGKSAFHNPSRSCFCEMSASE